MLIRSLINYITCATHLEFVICMLHYVSYGSLEYPEKGSFILFIKEILELSFIKLTFSRALSPQRSNISLLNSIGQAIKGTDLFYD